MTCNRVTLLPLLLACLAPLAAYATGLGAVLKDSPFTDFGDADYKQFFVAVKQAADGPVGGPAIDWSNDASGAHGTVKATREFQRQGGDCRELRGENTARGRSEPYRVTVCKGADGKWLLAPSEPKTSPKATAMPSAATPAAAAASAAAVAAGFPRKLPASFSGVLPCADCPGMEYRVEFHEDGSYRMRTTYLERGDNGTGKNVDDTGAWQLVYDGARVTLRSDGNTTTTFVIRDPDTLRLVDKNGDEFKSELNYDLKRAAVYEPNSNSARP